METRSNTLFHFTTSEEILFEIFRTGFWPRYCLEDITWHGYQNIRYAAFPIVCFCDIPLGRISEHIDFYGSYGIGLSKEWALKNNMNPLFYVSPGSNLSHTITEIVRNSISNPDVPKDKLRNFSRHLFAHIKPTIGNMLVKGELITKTFYQESEWRYVPQHPDIALFLKDEDYSDHKNLLARNKETKKYCSLKFLPNEVSFVFVPKDSDIPNIINFMQNELDHYPSADLKVLFSRVISIESINNNI